MFGSIISFFTGSSTRILIGVVVILGVIIGVQHYLSLKKDNKIQQMAFDISYLEGENQSLAMNIYTLNNLRDIENAELARVRQEHERLKQQTDRYLDEVEDAYKDSDDSPLSDSAIRVLNAACESVSGGACPAP